MSCATSELIFFCILRCSCEEEKDAIRGKYMETLESFESCRAELAALKQEEDQLRSGLSDPREGIEVSESYYKSISFSEANTALCNLISYECTSLMQPQ